MRPLLVAVALLLAAVLLAFYSCNRETPKPEPVAVATSTATPPTAIPATIPVTATHSPAPEATLTPEPANAIPAATHAWQYNGHAYRVGVDDNPVGIASIQCRIGQTDRWIEMLDLQNGLTGPFAVMRGNKRLTPLRVKSAQWNNENTKLVLSGISTEDPRINFDWELEFKPESILSQLRWSFGAGSLIYDILPDVREVGYQIQGQGAGTLSSTFTPAGVLSPAPDWIAWETGGIQCSVRPVAGAWPRAETQPENAVITLHSLWNPDGAGIPMGAYDAGILQFTFQQADQINYSLLHPRWDASTLAWVQEETSLSVPYTTQLSSGCMTALATCEGIASILVSPMGSTSATSLLGPKPLTFNLVLQIPGTELIPSSHEGQFSVMPDSVRYEGLGEETSYRWSVEWMAPKDRDLLLAAITWTGPESQWKPLLRPNLILNEYGNVEVTSGTTEIGDLTVRWKTRDFVYRDNIWQAFFGLGAVNREQKERLIASFDILEATDYFSELKKVREQENSRSVMRIPDEILSGIVSFAAPHVVNAKTHSKDGRAFLQSGSLLSNNPSSGSGSLPRSGMLDLVFLAGGDGAAVREDILRYAEQQTSDGLVPLEITSSGIRSASPMLSAAALILRIEQYLAWTGDNEFLKQSLIKPENMSESLLTACRRAADSRLPMLMNRKQFNPLEDYAKETMLWAQALKAISFWCHQNDLPGESERYAQAADTLESLIQPGIESLASAQFAEKSFSVVPILWSALLGYNDKGLAVDWIVKSRLSPYGVYDRSGDHPSTEIAFLAALAATRIGQPEKALHLLNLTANGIQARRNAPPLSTRPPWIMPAAFHPQTGESLGESPVAEALLYRLILEGFCGVRVTQEGLRFKPQMPPDWRGQTVQIQFYWRGIPLNLSIHDENRGFNEVYVNGHLQPPNFLFDQSALPVNANVEIR